MGKNIFLTGSTGFVGQSLLAEWLKKPNINLWVLLRPRGQTSALERLQKLKSDLSKRENIPLTSMEDRIHVVEGDIERDRLGLPESSYNELARKINRITHSAASVHLDLSESESYKMNVEGTKRILDLAEKAMEFGGLERFNYLSTAYVAGKRTGIIFENELDQGQGFVNSYEKTKLQAEKEVHAHMSRFPVSIFRPSIIVGHTKTGWTLNFNVIYAPLKLTYMGKIPILPGSKHTRLDTVPIDYVTQAIIHLDSLNEEVIGKTFHLVVGQGRAISMRDFIDQCAEHLIYFIDHYGLKNPKRVPKMIHPKLFDLLIKSILIFSKEAKKRAYQRFQAFAPYLYFYKDFNSDQATTLLKPAGIEVPRLSDYLKILCKYCVDNHFGMADGPRDVP